MEKNYIQGNFSLIPFAGVLFQIWQKEKSGKLHIQKDKNKRILSFCEGRIVIDEVDSLSPKIINTLSMRFNLNPSLLEECETYARENHVSLFKALGELGFFSPCLLWKILETSFKDEIFPLFDWEEGDYSFDVASLPQRQKIILSLETPDFILEGVRQMTNFNLITSHLPPEEETLAVLSPFHLERLPLGSYESHLLNVLEGRPSLKEIYERTELAKRECQKVLFAFQNIGIVDFSRAKSKSIYEFSPVDVEKMLHAFNLKCAYIYKYISKEIGLAALNVIEKCLEDIKPKLSSLFQKVELQPDGRLELKSFLTSNLNLYTENSKLDLVRDLNEILAAEVLTVKRTLGNEHEAVLIKSLEKIGEYP